MKNGEEKQNIIEKSSVIYGGNRFEQIYDPKSNTSYYMGWDINKQEVIRLEYIENGFTTYFPINDDLLQKKAVILANDATDYISIRDLEMCIDVFINTWLEISDEHRQKAVWYIMLSWVFERLNTIPYLRALGDYGTGKTRYLDVIGGLCYKPLYVGGSVRAAPIYRIIDRWRGTAIFDEFNLQKSSESEDIIQILNNGYQKGKPVLRCDATNYEKVNAFDPFCPKILASRKEFSDRALESRCITEIMHQASRDDIPSDFTREFYEQRDILQNKLLMYRLQNINVIDPDESRHVNFGSIEPRVKQSFAPFTVLFQHDKDTMKRFVEYVQRVNDQLVVDNSQSLDGMIVNHYLQMKANSEPYVTPQEIRNQIVNDGGATDKLDARTIGRRLKPLGFNINHKRIGKQTIREVSIDTKILASLKKRYVLNEPEAETSQEKIDFERV
jgi:hypothetical protein